MSHNIKNKDVHSSTSTNSFNRMAEKITNDSVQLSNSKMECFSNLKDSNSESTKSSKESVSNLFGDRPKIPSTHKQAPSETNPTSISKKPSKDNDLASDD